MKIPVDITIKTDKILDDPIEGNNKNEVREVTVPGYLKTGKAGITVEYTENDSELSDITTFVNIPGNGLVMMTRGNDSGMVFENGKTHSCVFNNGIIPMEIRVRTKKLISSISPMGGKLDVDYTVDVMGSRAEKSHLTLSVKPAESNYVS